jgi:hypothetical protein
MARLPKNSKKYVPPTTSTTTTAICLDSIVKAARNNDFNKRLVR